MGWKLNRLKHSTVNRKNVGSSPTQPAIFWKYKMIKLCKIHGETKFSLQGKYLRCLKCNVIKVTKKRKSLKIQAVEYKGGKCERCNYNKSVNALHFHHRDPNEKDFGIGQSGYTRSWDKVKEELDKCILVCANCHAEIHEELL